MTSTSEINDLSENGCQVLARSTFIFMRLVQQEMKTLKNCIPVKSDKSLLLIKEAFTSQRVNFPQQEKAGVGSASNHSSSRTIKT